MTIAARNQIIYQLYYWQTLGCRALEGEGWVCQKKRKISPFLGSLNFALCPLFCILHNCQMIDYRSLVLLSEDPGSLSSAVCLPILLWWFVGLLSEILVASSGATALFSKRIVPNFRTIRSLLTKRKQLAKKSFSGVYVSIKCLWVSVCLFIPNNPHCSGNLYELFSSFLFRVYLRHKKIIKSILLFCVFNTICCYL